MSTLADFVSLSLTPFSWRRTLGEHLRAGATPADALRAIVPGDLDPENETRRLLDQAQYVLTRAEQQRIAAVTWSDPAYPPALAAIYDPPPLLWVRGDATCLLRPAVAIVGSRAGTPYARAMAERLAGDLAGAGVLVVSGMARGVDSAAHRGALAAGGRTAAVLGSGVDVVYPCEHAALAGDIAGGGAVVSELAPGTRPLPWFFPRRNRIISGLSRAVVVIEAGERSGSLITARCALEQGRDVLAVPGNALTGRNRGGHALLRDGAKIVESADDILDELSLGPMGPPGSRAASERGTANPSQAVLDPVLGALVPGEACDVDGISARSGLPTARVLPRLFELELQGLIRRVGGGRFVRVDRSC